jgi:hypothetical protein
MKRITEHQLARLRIRNENEYTVTAPPLRFPDVWHLDCFDYRCRIYPSVAYVSIWTTSILLFKKSHFKTSFLVLKWGFYNGIVSLHAPY